MRFLGNIAVAVNRNCIRYFSIKYNFRHNTKRLLSLFICFSIVLVEDLLSADINEVDLRESIRRGSQFSTTIRMRRDGGPILTFRH